MYVVVGTGGVGAVVGARLVRRGHSVLFCDTDASHVEAMNRHGLAIEGPDAITVTANAVEPEELPDQLGAVLLAVRAHDTPAALGQIAPRLAATGMVVSLQDGLTEHAITDAVGPERTLGALVTMVANRANPAESFSLMRAACASETRSANSRPPGSACSATLSSSSQRERGRLPLGESRVQRGTLRYGVADVGMADALQELRFRPLYVRSWRRCLPSPQHGLRGSNGLDPKDLRRSIERAAERVRRFGDAPLRGVLRPSCSRAARGDRNFRGLEGPLLSRLLTLIRQIELGHANVTAGNLRASCCVRRVHAHWNQAQRGDHGPGAVVASCGGKRRAYSRGAPVAIKDNIDVRGVVTTNASSVGVPPAAEEDATVVLRLRNAGAELVCKTNLLEYAAGSVGPAFGMTFNPRQPQRTSGGSSGGSAALVAAGVCEHALGTDTGGSVRVPAAYCGIVGLKPTSGLVPLDGVFPLSPSLDQVGTLTQTVGQAATLLGVIAGRRFRIRAVGELRAGVLRQHLDDPAVTTGVRACIEGALERLHRAGIRLVDVEIPELEAVDHVLGAIVAKEAFNVHQPLLEREAAHYGAGTRALLELGRDLDPTEYEQALVERRQIARAFARVFEHVEVLVGPTVAFTAPHEDPPVGDPEGAVEGRFTGPYSLAGTPAISMPCGLAESELPAGLQLAAASGADELLLSVAAVYEGFNGRVE